MSFLAALFCLAFLLQATPDPPIDPEEEQNPEREEEASQRQATPVGSPDVGIRFFFMPRSLYSPSYGFGLGAGFSVTNLLNEGSELRVTAEPSQNRGFYAASVRTNDPDQQRFFGLAQFRYELSGVHGYFGIGGDTDRRNRLAVKLESFAAEFRPGYQTEDRLFLFQPFLAYRWNMVHGYRELHPNAVARMDEVSRENILFSAGHLPERESQRRQVGVASGMRLSYDTRDSQLFPTRGLVVQVVAEHYGGISADVRINSLAASVYQFVQVGSGRDVLGLRFSTALTRSESKDPVPFYMLPFLDERTTGAASKYRLVGNDVLYADIRYTRTLINVLDAIEMEGFVWAGMGNAYTNIFKEFQPALSLRSQFPTDQSRYPMRPVCGLGFELVSLLHNELIFNGSIGFSAEGYTLGAFSFVYDLRHQRIPLR